MNTVCWVDFEPKQSSRVCKNTVFWGDECSFHLNGNVNRHNLFYYSKENEHLTIVGPLKSAAITVWPAVSYYHGLTITDQTINSERHVQILSTKVASFIRLNEIYQQDGVPRHFILLARNWLNEHLHGRWILRWAPSWTLETWILRMAAQISGPDYLRLLVVVLHQRKCFT